VTGELSNSIAEDTSKQLRFERKTERTNSVNQSPTDAIRRGSAGPVGTMMLLKSRQQLHAPFTQDPPLMTEDMHEERLQAVEAFGDSLVSRTSFPIEVNIVWLSTKQSFYKDNVS
jgi:Rab3 GTPase-activating protein catalytic subunit